MALTSTIPPQAYTRDTLVKAIEWIGTQPSAIRERANSADLVVSYYLQACRKAAVQMEAPVSQENFKSDLKHLAEDLKQFEAHSFAPPPTAAPPPANRSTFDPPPVPTSLTWTIDPRSMSAIREIQQRLNLSSEAEAIRLLITLGSERARQLFP